MKKGEWILATSKDWKEFDKSKKFINDTLNFTSSGEKILLVIQGGKTGMDKQKLETATPAKSRTTEAGIQAIPLNFRLMTGKHFDFELKANQQILFLPYTTFQYDKKNEVYWLYVVIITPGKPNKYFRTQSYDLNFSVMNFEETNAHYGATVLLKNGDWLNAWYVNENSAFITQLSRSSNGTNFTQFVTNPAKMEAGEDMSFWQDEDTNRIYLFERNLNPAKEKRRQAVRYSDDNGVTWSSKQIVLEIPESERTKVHGVFWYCVVYSMTVCRFNNKFYSAVNVFNEATGIVSIRLAQSDDLYNWEWLNGGRDIIPIGDNGQMYGAICNYIEPGANDVPPRLILLVQSSKAKHIQGETGIFRLSLYENITN